MDRRKFIKIGTGAVAVGAMSGSVVLRAAEISAENKASDDLTKGNPASEYSTARYSSEIGEAGKKDLLVRFLGTGAADWNGMDERGELRRLSSVLLDNRILIDSPRLTRTCCRRDSRNLTPCFILIRIPTITTPGPPSKRSTQMWYM